MVEIKLLVYIGIVHFFDSHSIIQKLFIFVIESFIGYVKENLPTLTFSNLSLDLGFRSGWYFFDIFLNAYLTSSGLALTGSSTLDLVYIRHHNRTDPILKAIRTRELGE